MKNLYLYIQTVPDRLYPFTSNIEGKLVRGRASYAYALDQAFKKYGQNHFGYKLIVYRGTFHLMASIFSIVVSTFLSQRLFGSEIALYIMMTLMIVTICVQEFFWQPRAMGQLRYKGVVDTLTWLAPVAFYFTFIQV